MSELLFERSPRQESCDWLLHKVRPADWTWHRNDRAALRWITDLAMLRPQDNIAPTAPGMKVDELAQLYAEFQQIYDKLQRTTLSVTEALHQLSRNRDQLLQLKEEILTIRREIGVA